MKITANRITMIRIILVPIIVLMIMYIPKYPVLRLYGMLFFIIAIGTDLIDGYIARKLSQVTTIGRIIDPIADKIMINTIFILMVFIAGLPSWIAVIVLSRDVLIVLGWVAIYLIFGREDFPNKLKQGSQNYLGKMAVGFQMLTILVILYNYSPGINIYQNITVVLFCRVMVTITVASALLYIIKSNKLFA